MNRIIFVITLFLGFSALFAQSGENGEENFLQMCDSLFDNGFQEIAVNKLQSKIYNADNTLFNYTKSLIGYYEEQDMYGAALDIIRWGHTKSYFYLMHPMLDKYKPYKELPGFFEVAKKDSMLRSEAIEKSTTTFVISGDTASSEPVPVLFLLHGGGRNMRSVQEAWTGIEEMKNLLLVYVQSYRYYDYNTYGWRGKDPRAVRELKEIYDSLLQSYPIDESAVYITGMSAGARMAMDITIGEDIPVKGCLLLSPALSPGDYTDEEIAEAIAKGKRIFIVAGEEDPYYERAKPLIDNLLTHENNTLLELIPEMGHVYPPNLPDILKRAIEYFQE